MPVIPVDLDSAKEMKPVPLGKYALTVSTCEEVTSSKGKPQYDMSISIDGHDDAPNIRNFVSLPNEKDEPNAFKYKVLLLKRLCHLFKVPLSGNSLDTTAIAMAFVGKRATAEVGIDKETNADGTEKQGGRVFNRLVVPPLPDDAVQGRVAPPPPKS